MIKRSFYKETIDVHNSDTANIDKEIQTNTSIVNFLYEIGERSAANYLEKRIVQNAETKYSDSLNKEYNKNEKIKQKELIKISSINSGILDRLDKIEKNMVDEQDTSIKKIQKPVESAPALQIIREEAKREEKGLSWFDMLLGSLLGAGMLKFLKGFKDLGPIKFAISLMEKGWVWLKDKVIDVAKDIAKAVMKPIEEILDFILEKLSKIPGLEDLKNKYKLGNNKPADKPKAADKPKVSTPDVDKPKVNIPDVNANKLAKETEKATAKSVAEMSGKNVSKSLLKKFPFLGLGIAGTFAADRLSEGDFVGAAMELSSGVLSIVPGLGTAGSFAVDASLIVRDIKRMNEAVITKLDDAGIIDKGFFGDTTVEKWDKVKELSIDDLKALAEYEDLDKNDRERVQNILYKKQVEQIKVPEDTLEFNDGVKIIFNEREILADSLLKSDDKLQEFLTNNPFTDDNSETIEREINGEKVKEIKFKDEELNKQYMELKEQYDKDFKKYKESRNSQLKNLKGIHEIEGELLTSEQVKDYKSSAMSLMDYSTSLVKSSAQQDVSASIAEQYKNITMPTGDIVERIKKNEGLRLHVYKDSLGYPTIGYGHLIKPGEMSQFANGITKEQADILFAKDFEEHKKAAMKIPSFSEHPKEIQDTLIDMTFNMGNYWYTKWPDTIKKLQAKDYEGVKQAILKSKYATQVKGRAIVNAKTFELAQNIKTAKTSDTVRTPETSKESEANINILDKNDASVQKQAQAQKIEDINKNLINNTKTTSSVNPTIVNNISTSNQKQEESHSLGSLFGTYS